MKSPKINKFSYLVMQDPENLDKESWDLGGYGYKLGYGGQMPGRVIVRNPNYVNEYM